MMKPSLIFTLTLFVSQVIYGQEIQALKMTSNGFEPIVLEVINVKAHKLYVKAINWVNEIYKNPEDVLKVRIKDEKIRLNGFATDAYWYSVLGVKYYKGLNYFLVIEFKDGRYRLTFLIDEKDLTFFKANFYKKNGEVRNVGKDAINSLEQTVNELSNSLYNYITSDVNKDDDW